MKLQDIVYFCILTGLVFYRRPVLLLWVGLGSLVLSIPLFAGWIFFTAERLTWYAAGFFMVYLLFSLKQ